MMESKSIEASVSIEKSQLKVEVVGTSNPKNLGVAYIGEKEFLVSKVLKYIIQPMITLIL